MYDPAVVEGFLSTLDEIVAEEASLTAVPPQPLEAANDEPTLVEDTAAPTTLAARCGVLPQVGAALASDGSGLQSQCARLQALLARIMPAAACVVYGYDADSDELRPRAAAGLHAEEFSSLRILNGERLTGWVTANRQPIVNSDAALDLADTPLARLTPGFHKCAAVPIVRGGDILGALVVYSSGGEFTADDSSTLQAVAEQIVLDR